MSRGPIKKQSLDLLRRRGVPIRTILDVGVLHGTPELIKAFPDIPHILFEPVAEFADAIASAYANITHTLVSAAVSERSGETALATTSILSGLDISHSYMTDESIQHAKRVVPMVSLDEYLSRHPADAPYLLKIDIDGHEMNVLRGAVETLKQTSAVIIETPVDEIVERLAFLASAGFRRFDLTEPCYYDSSLWQCDAILIRRDIHDQHFSHIHRGFDEQKYEMFKG